MWKTPVGWTHMMKKDNTMTLNTNVKSNLAKLLATENITVQHDKVSTASFDVKNRILTLPIFKEKSGDVYDMLIAHECSHALFTPYEEWEGITDSELRSYVNVIEDTRIDKLIQAKYPGVVKNYINGFDILEKKNFFGLMGKDVNKDLMIIDKINIRSKSLNRVPFSFTDQDNEWLSKVDSVVTFKDAVDLAKEMLAWQKEQVEEMAKLPNFDELSIVKSYDLGNDDDFDDEYDNQPSGDQGDESDEKNDFNNFGDEKGDDEKEAEQEGASDKSDEKKQDDQGKVSEQYGKGADGEPAKKLLKAVTDQAYENKKDELLDSKARGFVYGKMPEPNLKSIVGYKQFLKEMQEYRIKQRQYNYDDNKYMSWLKDIYKKFQKENKKTVMYLVKEFEMKKAATAYKRASTDKTGIIDPLKLPNYKFSDDIFKRLTIVPDGKNHGMMMLLDWSGSMSDTLMNTVEQLLNLVEFVRKVNIPFEVYFFTSERGYSEEAKVKSFDMKEGDWFFESYNLVNCFSHRMTKQEFTTACMYMYHMAYYYNSNYVYHKNWNDDLQMARYKSYGIPNQFSLGNTPLNEALIFCNELIPMFKKKYDIEKMTFVTLTDGGANSFQKSFYNTAEYGTDEWYTKKSVEYDKQAVLQIGKDKIISEGYGDLTTKLLNHIGKKYDVNVIGFFILKRVKNWDIEQYIDGDFVARQKALAIAKKEMSKNKAIAVDKNGYSKYFLLDGKKMKVEQFDLAEANVKKGTSSELKRIFGKSMANRLVSRVVLNKF